MIPLLTLIIGTAIGWYAKRVYEMLQQIIKQYEERQIDRKAGIVTPVIRKGIPTRQQLQNLEENETGGVRPLTPKEKAREDRLKAAEILRKSIEG